MNCLSIELFVLIFMSYHETDLDDYDVEDDNIEYETDYDSED